MHISKGLKVLMAITNEEKKKQDVKNRISIKEKLVKRFQQKLTFILGS